MANRSAQQFARLLTEAVYRIRHLESKSIQAVQDDLGYSLGKRGGSSIEYWRKGYAPAKEEDIETLAVEIFRHGKFTREWMRQFLLSAEYPEPDGLLDRLYEVSPPAETAVSPHEAARTAVPANFPAPPTPFLGRVAELTAIIEQLQDLDCRILTLVGQGGIGKTRLAQQAALARPELFPDGIYFIPLATVSSPEFMLSTIANAINLSFADSALPRAQLLNYLQSKRLLLIMDNFEHLMTEATLIAEIVTEAPQVQVLITSRERLRLHGEWVFQVRGMQVPSRKMTEHLSPEAWADMAEYSAVQLFLQSARRASADFDLALAAIPHVVRICQLVDGYPLAIELAATWVRLLTCAEIAAEIERDYEILSTNWRDMPARHRSLQAVFDYSWQLLPEHEQRVLCQLTVFERGFQREAAVAVAQTSLPVLASLVDKSFLQRSVAEPREGRRETAVIRFELHELLRLYVVGKLDEEVRTAVQDRHATYYAAFLQKRRSLLQEREQLAALAEIGAEIDNVRAAWRWAVERGDIEVIRSVIDPLFLFYDIRGWLQEGSEIFKTAAQRLRVMRQTKPNTIDDIIWGKVLAREGQFAYRLGRYERARGLLLESLPIFRKLDMQKETVFLLNLLGKIAYRQGAYVEAETHCQDSLAICDRIQYEWGMVSALATLGHLAVDRGAYAEAKQLYGQGLRLGQQAGDQHSVAMLLNDLGNVSWRLGEYDLARQLCTQSLTLFQEIDDRQGIAMAYKNLGNIAGDTGDVEQARSLYRTALAICQEIGYRWGVAALLNNLGNVAWEMGNHEEARQFCAQSVAVWREIGFLWGIAGSLETLANVDVALGETHHARAYIREALEIGAAINAVPLVLDVLISLARLLLTEGQQAAAGEILAYVLRHPAMDQEGRTKAQSLMQDVPLVMPAANGAQKSIDEVVTAVLRTIL
ncbi:MAG: tetratricopeptide repeat protein [Chloroflexi bacterium]|nr:tetratricopeptide repeat protein [Chloroflexota bacterium]MBP7590153.1 tetratricopeptide repeat protein [Chloroflexota bacterium]